MKISQVLFLSFSLLLSVPTVMGTESKNNNGSNGKSVPSNSQNNVEPKKNTEPASKPKSVEPIKNDGGKAEMPNSKNDVKPIGNVETPKNNGTQATVTSDKGFDTPTVNVLPMPESNTSESQKPEVTDPIQPNVKVSVSKISESKTSTLTSRAKETASASVNFVMNGLDRIGKKESALLCVLAGYVVSGEKLAALKAYEVGISKGLAAVTVATVLYATYKVCKACSKEEKEEAIDFNFYDYESSDIN